MTLFVLYIYLFTFINDEKLLNVCYGCRVRESSVFRLADTFKTANKVILPDQEKNRELKRKCKSSLKVFFFQNNQQPPKISNKKLTNLDGSIFFFFFGCKWQVEANIVAMISILSGAPLPHHAVS